MQIVHYRNIDFDIDRQGRISRKSTWQVMPDEIDLSTWPDLAAAIRDWAGHVGDPWRRPLPDSQGFATEEEFVVTDIGFKAQTRYMYEVTFTGQPKGMTAEMLGQPELSVNENGEREKSGRWLIHADALEEFLPEPGAVITWAGTLYLCRQVDCRDAGGKRYEVTIRARDMAKLMIGLPTCRRSANLESVKTAKWRVDAEAAPAFMTENDINADASSWAGDGYFVIAVRAEPIGQSGYYCTVEARHMGIRQIDIRKSTRYLRHDEVGGIVCETVYSGRWQVHKDHLPELENCCGQAADEWAEAGYIVTSVEPVRLSEVEYQVTLQARRLAASRLFAPLVSDDRSNLSSRKDVTSGYGEFKLSAEQCGWFRNGEEWVKLNSIAEKTWIPGKDCPLRTVAELDWSLAETPLSTVMVEVTEYWRGQVSRHISSLSEWESSGDILSGYTLCGSTASWRKIDQKADLILDNDGDPWTRVLRIYQKAPGGFNWNVGFSGFSKQP